MVAQLFPEPFLQPRVSHRLAWPSALVLSPLLIVQGKQVRSRVPKLPHAPQPWGGQAPGPEPIRVLGFGDSTIAGVGVTDAGHGLVAQFSLALGDELQRGVTWRAVGQSGATTKDLLRDFLPGATAEPADVVLISVGANDAKDLKPLGATINRFERLMTVLQEAHPDSVLLFSSLPAFHLFPTLPQPLRGIMYAHAQAIERSVRPLIESSPRAFMSPPPPRYSEGFFAVDGFHPSVQGYRDWARFTLSDALERGALGHLMRR
jgi:lysophospholipase L1-like esterase